MSKLLRNKQHKKREFPRRVQMKIWQISGLTLLPVGNKCCSLWEGALSLEQTTKELEAGGKQTITDWHQYRRDVAVMFSLNNPDRLDSPDRIVEIDESLFARPKYHREKWIMGGYDYDVQC